MVYCEDLESTNGTFVNGHCIGSFGQERIGYLLSDGDVVEIRPRWRFQFRQLSVQRATEKNRNELEGMKHFQDQFHVSNRILGKGRYGVVYLGKEITRSRQVACKIVNLDLAAHCFLGSTQEPTWRWQSARNEAMEKVLREIRILEALDHVKRLCTFL